MLAGFYFLLIVVVGIFAKYYFWRVAVWDLFCFWVGFWGFVRSECGSIHYFSLRGLVGFGSVRGQSGRGVVVVYTF